MAVLALVAEWRVGYPGWLLRSVGHPVIWIGGVIAALDRALNRETMPERTRLLNGMIAQLVILSMAASATLLLEAFAVRAAGSWSLLLLVPVASTLLAQRSLEHHVTAVAQALERGVDRGREAVAHIVGRDPASLDGPAIARAAIESLAENFSDGVVAPAFWCAVAGLPGIALYKAANTADSMIGHRTPRHRDFGWAAARFDDLVNLPASRLGALLLVLAAASLRGADARNAWRTVWRDARRHRSPNAGWPEAAMAGAFGLRLAGPRIYDGRLAEDGWIGDGRPDANAADILAAVALYRRACLIQIVGYALLLVALIARG